MRLKPILVYLLRAWMNSTKRHHLCYHAIQHIGLNSETIILLFLFPDEYVEFHFEFHKSLEPNKLTPSELLVGEKALVYLHSNKFDIFNSFW